MAMGLINKPAMDICPNCGDLKIANHFFCKKCFEEGSDLVQLTVLLVGGRIEQQIRAFYSNHRTIKTYR